MALCSLACSIALAMTALAQSVAIVKPGTPQGSAASSQEAGTRVPKKGAAKAPRKGRRKTKTAAQLRAAAARRALVAAGKKGRAPKGSKADVRRKCREEALADYRKVKSSYGDLPGIVAEAEFRSAQVLSRLGKAKEAVAGFRRAAKLDAKNFGARALVEAGHTERRSKRYSAALEFYREATGQSPSRYRLYARLWTGRVLLTLGRAADARKTWQDLAMDSKADSLIRLQAFDDLAMHFLAIRQIEDARRVLQDADEQLAAEASGDGRSAKTLRGRLDRMRAKKKLAKLNERVRAKGDLERR